MPKVEIYTRPFCPFCVRARRLLTARGIEFHETDLSRNPDAAAVMQQRAGRTSVPQIFINDHHVGGSDDLAAADASGQLAQLVGKAA